MANTKPAPLPLRLTERSDLRCSTLGCISFERLFRVVRLRVGRAPARGCTHHHRLFGWEGPVRIDWKRRFGEISHCITHTRLMFMHILRNYRNSRFGHGRHRESDAAYFRWMAGADLLGKAAKAIDDCEGAAQRCACQSLAHERTSSPVLEYCTTL